VKIFTKAYADPRTQQQALAHQRWVTQVNPDVPTPAVVGVRAGAIDFQHIEGRHAKPDDLDTVAHILGHQHATAHARELHAARLDTPHTSGTLTIADFATGRRERLHQLLASGAVSEAPLQVETVDDWLRRAASLPTAFYKDANPRNFLLTDTAAVVIDFDSLTLAPFGYDLAKLIVSTTMTTGPLPGATIQRALDTYNSHPLRHGLPPCTRPEFTAWCQFHEVLTAPYLGTNGYRFHSRRAWSA